LSGPFCKVERKGALTVITINRPEVMNALHPPAQEELSGALDAFAADPAQWVAILTGAGDRAFCAGNDLKYHASDAPRWRLASGFGGVTSRFDLVGRGDPGVQPAVGARVEAGDDAWARRAVTG